MLYNSKEYQEAVKQQETEIKKQEEIGFPEDWIEVLRRSLYAFKNAVRHNTLMYDATCDPRLK